MGIGTLFGSIQPKSKGLFDALEIAVRLGVFLSIDAYTQVMDGKAAIFIEQLLTRARR